MTFLSIHHVQLAAPKGCEETARAFFGGVLGFEEIPKPARLAGRGGLWFREGYLEIHIGVEDEFRPARKAHIAFQVDDLERVRKRLEGAGVEVQEDEALPGYERFYAHDPFGNRLEFLQLSD